jgi:chemotaxis methyl-accepting protein methylase
MAKAISEHAVGSTALKIRAVRKIRSLWLTLAQGIWKLLPVSMRDSGIGRAYARWLDRMVRLNSDRRQYFATFFLRNRPELELLGRLANRAPHKLPLNICILACSKGAEVYSIAWALRSVRPDMNLRIYAIDISQEIVDFAARGTYEYQPADRVQGQPDRNPAQDSSNTALDQNAWMFERLSPQELNEIFELGNGTATVRGWLREGITWLCRDAADPSLLDEIGPQDIVVANRFLCHMQPAEAEQCLRNIARLVNPGGHLFVTGIDLEVRTEVALDLKWSAVPDLLQEIHDGDESIRRGWPMEYWGLEPIDFERPDWRVRYACAFQLGEAHPDLTIAAGVQAGKGATCDSSRPALPVHG